MEKFFWADAIAEKIIKEKPNKRQYVCASGITPSGTIHIGNFREVITTELVVKALKDKGKKVRFIYSWDDYDRLRRVPVNIPNPKSYEKYLGMPLSEIPSPSKKRKNNYAEVFEKQFENSLKKVNIKPKFIKQSEMYKKCKYAKLIKITLDKKEEIKEILNKYRKESLRKDWYPIEIYCEKCKKDTTNILNYKEYEIEYECKCGFKGKFDFRKKGFVKLKWRVDWPMRWSYEKVDFEPGGIDHSVYGGSYMTGKEIAKKIYNYEPPLYVFYDWIKIKGGKEFSSSKGNILTLDDVEEIYEPEVLRYIFASTRPNRGFQISFDNDVIKIYEEYDALEKKYYENKASSQEKRIYELSQIKKVSKKKPSRISFRHLITIIQTGKTKNLNLESKKRAKKVSKWLEKYAPEDFKFQIQEEINIKLNEKEREALVELKERLKKRDFTEEQLFNEFYNICNKLGIKNTEFFNAAYKVIIGKNKGPRLATLILTAGKDKIIKLLEKIK